MQWSQRQSYESCFAGRQQLEAAWHAPDGHVFLNSRGRPWTNDGFRTVWQDAKDAAGTGRELHFHDLRGNAATMVAASANPSYSDLQIDLFMGWKEGAGARIRRKYVNARNIAKDLRALLEGEAGPATEAATA